MKKPYIARLNFDQIKERIDNYNSLFENMTSTGSTKQDREYIENYLKAGLREANEGLSWLKTVDVLDVQVSEKDIKELEEFKKLIEHRLQTISASTEE